MRASCIAFVILAAAAAPALSGPVAADELIGRYEQVGVPPSSSYEDNTQPVNPTDKRFTDRLIDRDEDESIGANSPTSQHGPPWPGSKRLTDRPIDRDEGEEDGTPAYLLHGRVEALPPPISGPPPQPVHERFTDELIGRDGESVDQDGPSGPGWRRMDKRFTDKLFGRDKAITARDD
ncbi:hypothetical protein EDB92DRAFT_1951991 [Lactarius akahatsu]|uniref:Uncharacterized protein n=1 Tax=Lactarius akahatsu TaxID=416441 RepID=A0AAD4LCD1_9AGAM|nr:hypothetical protein EDB92DRAFT_1951991 [Lactarius akahatsu]